jgi:hypothetical protein
MDDFPIWLKAIVWLTALGTGVYAVGAMIYYTLIT